MDSQASATGPQNAGWRRILSPPWHTVSWFTSYTNTITSPNGRNRYPSGNETCGLKFLTFTPLGYDFHPFIDLHGQAFGLISLPVTLWPVYVLDGFFRLLEHSRNAVECSSPHGGTTNMMVTDPFQLLATVIILWSSYIWSNHWSRASSYQCLFMTPLHHEGMQAWALIQANRVRQVTSPTPSLSKEGRLQEFHILCFVRGHNVPRFVLFLLSVSRCVGSRY